MPSEKERPCRPLVAMPRTGLCQPTRTKASGLAAPASVELFRRAHDADVEMLAGREVKGDVPAIVHEGAPQGRSLDHGGKHRLGDRARDRDHRRDEDVAIRPGGLGHAPRDRDLEAAQACRRADGAAFGSSATSSARSPLKRSRAASSARRTADSSPSALMMRSIGPSLRCSRPEERRPAIDTVANAVTHRRHPRHSGRASPQAYVVGAEACRDPSALLACACPAHLPGIAMPSLARTACGDA